MSTTNIIQELILFYITENYNQYLKDHKIKKIPENEIKTVITELYDKKKDHLQQFLKNSLKEIMKDDYIGDLPLLNICSDIFNDDELCKNRLIIEIIHHQKNKV